MTYIATFYSHFGAIRFKKLCEGRGWPVKLMPVPRSLSSSCGTCARFAGDGMCPSEAVPEEVEQIVRVEGPHYERVYAAENF